MKKLFLISLISLFALGLVNSSVDAISNLGPDENDFNLSQGEPANQQNMRYLLDTSGFQSNVSVIAVYSQTPNMSVTVISPGLCSDGSGLDSLGPAGTPWYNVGTTYRLEPYDPPNPSTWYDIASYTGCSPSGLNNVTLTGTIPAAQTEVIGGITWYKAKVRAQMTTNVARVGNTFELRNNNPGGVISYYSLSGNEFGIQNRAALASPEQYNDYHLYFGSDCEEVTSPTTTRLEWWDDDFVYANSGNYGIQRNSNGGFGLGWYSMRLIERNRAGTLTNRWMYRETVNGVVSIPAGWSAFPNTSGFVNNQAYGWAEFVAQPNHTYEWVWTDVRKQNAIQFEVPYDSIYYLYDCGQYQYDARLHAGSSTPTTNTTNPTTVQPGDVIYIQGDNENDGAGAGPNYTLEIYPNRGGGEVTKISRTGGDQNGLGSDTGRWINMPGLNPGANGANRWVRYQVDADAVDGTEICFRVRVSPVTPTNSGWNYTGANSWCYEVGRNTYTYDPLHPNAQSGSVNAGTTFSWRSRVENTSGDTGSRGQAYSQIVEVTQGTDSIRIDSITAGGTFVSTNGTDTATYGSQGGLLAGGGRNEDITFTIPAGALDGETICIQTTVTPATGLASPGTTTGSGTATEGPDCFTVYNQRYEMANEFIDIPTTGFPGQTITISYDVWNISTTGATPDAPTAVADRVRIFSSNAFYRQGTAPNTGRTTNAYGLAPTANLNPSTYTLNLPSFPTAQVGEEWCVRLEGNFQEGWSDGSANIPWANGRYVEDCLTISEAPFMHVENQGVWAGGALDPNTIGGSWCTPVHDPLFSTIRGVMDGPIGAFSEFSATALADIDAFGTPAVGSTVLAFRNNPTPAGNYNTDGRCIPDYYEYLNKSGAGVSATSTFPGGSAPSGQYFVNGDLTIGSDRNIGLKQFTLVVNGDVTIDGNIRYGSGGNYSANQTDNNSNNDVPILIIVANGDINIQGSVDELEGIFIAQGEIDTCYNGPNDLTINTCNNDLIVRGAFVADDIEFRRTHSGIVRAPNEPAELFEFSYDMYIANPVLISDIEPNLRSSLVRDLPPVY